MYFSRILKSSALIAAASLGLGACSEPTAPQTNVGQETTTTEAAAEPEVDYRTQVASLMMPGVENFDDALAKLEAGVGGIFITGWADPGLLTEPGRDINALREIVDRPFDVSIDFEGGRVQRFSEILGSFPSAREMAATRSPEEVEGLAAEIGQTLKDRGINLNFAPVLDVDGGNLDVVGDRAFSADPVTAGDYGAAFARGLESVGVKSAFKHFPGHGRATGDSHNQSVVTPPLEELFTQDLVPYDVAMPQSPQTGVMVGHLSVPGLGDGTTPASLNNQAYEILRDRFNFEGVAYTDDLTGMRAITDNYSPEEAIVEAINAGADQALWSTAVDINSVIDYAERELDPELVAAASQRVSDNFG